MSASKRATVSRHALSTAGGATMRNAARTTGGFGAVDQKVLGEEYGDDGFPQTDHVGEEKTTVLVEDVTALFDGIELIVEGGEVLGEIAGEGVAEVLVEDVAKLVDEGFVVEFCGREGGGGRRGWGSPLFRETAATRVWSAPTCRETTRGGR